MLPRSRLTLLFLMLSLMALLASASPAKRAGGRNGAGAAPGGLRHRKRSAGHAAKPRPAGKRYKQATRADIVRRAREPFKRQSMFSAMPGYCGDIQPGRIFELQAGSGTTATSAQGKFFQRIVVPGAEADDIQVLSATASTGGAAFRFTPECFLQAIFPGTGTDDRLAQLSMGGPNDYFGFYRASDVRPIAPIVCRAYFNAQLTAILSCPDTFNNGRTTRLKGSNNVLWFSNDAADAPVDIELVL